MLAIMARFLHTQTKSHGDTLLAMDLGNYCNPSKHKPNLLAEGDG